jgi:O-antigen/teichoic acid export membrane protein
LLTAVGFGALISLAASVWAFAPRALPGYRLHLTLFTAYLSGRMGYALGNHLSQLTWGLPPLIYPLLVAGLLGVEANAHFYTAWMVANLLFMIPLAVSTASFATASFASSSSTASNSAALRHGPLWRAMRLTLLGLVPVALAFMLFARPVMQLFGESYSTNYELLVLFSASIFPYTINTFVITAYRLGSHIRSLVCLSVSIAGLSIGLVAVLCGYLGLLGIGWGWLLAQTIGLLLSSLGYLTSLRARPPAR